MAEPEGFRAVCEASETVQWIVSSKERREPKRAAGNPIRHEFRH